MTFSCTWISALYVWVFVCGIYRQLAQFGIKEKALNIFAFYFYGDDRWHCIKCHHWRGTTKINLSMKAFLSVRKITMNMFSITMLTFPQYDTVLPSFPNQITIRTHLLRRLSKSRTKLGFEKFKKSILNFRKNILSNYFAKFCYPCNGCIKWEHFKSVLFYSHCDIS